MNCDNSRERFQISAWALAVLPVVRVLVDYLALVASEYCAFVLRNFWVGNHSLRISWLNFWITFPCLFLIFNAVEGLYTHRMQFWKMLERLFRTCICSLAALVLVLYVARIAARTSRLFPLLFVIFAFVAMVLCRYVMQKVVNRFDCFRWPVLVIGAGRTAELLVSGVLNDPALGYHIIGLLEDVEVSSPLLRGYPVLGGFADAEDVIRRTRVQYVMIAAPGLPQDRLTHLIYQVQPLVRDVSVIPNLVGVPMGGIEAESLFNEKLLLLRLRNNLAHRSNIVLKALFDYSLALLGVICLSPFLLLIAAWVYKDSPGPVFFKHKRIGKNGKEFPCYKFRSMCVDADEKLRQLLENDPEAREEWNREFKLKNDPRVTRIGAFLRKTSLDELPQLFNVLRGEMSLVGPRPIVRAEMERYGDLIKDYLMVKPGITGMWQISGRSDIDYPERVQMDSWYVRNWSVWLDIMLVCKTFKVVLLRKGAY